MTTSSYERQPTTTEVAEAALISRHNVVRFDHNTSPFPTDWALGRITAATRTLNEYPEADYRVIREAAAAFTGVEPHNVIPGAGIDELVQLVANAFLEPDSSAVMLTPTYPLYRIATSLRAARVVELPLIEPDFAFPLDNLLGASRDADVTWLCLPNNPTGNHPGLDLVAALAEPSSGIIVVDAAYAEIAGDDWSSLAERFDNVVVLYTLSKGFGLDSSCGSRAARPSPRASGSPGHASAMRSDRRSSSARSMPSGPPEASRRCRSTLLSPPSRNRTECGVASNG